MHIDMLYVTCDATTGNTTGEMELVRVTLLVKDPWLPCLHK